MDNKNIFTLHTTSERGVSSITNVDAQTSADWTDAPRMADLTFWRRNYFFNFSTSCK